VGASARHRGVDGVREEHPAVDVEVAASRRGSAGQHREVRSLHEGGVEVAGRGETGTELRRAGGEVRHGYVERRRGGQHRLPVERDLDVEDPSQRLHAHQRSSTQRPREIDEVAGGQVVVVDRQSGPRLAGQDVGGVDRPRRHAVDGVEGREGTRLLEGDGGGRRHDAPHAAPLDGQTEAVRVGRRVRARPEAGLEQVQHGGRAVHRRSLGGPGATPRLRCSGRRAMLCVRHPSRSSAPNISGGWRGTASVGTMAFNRNKEDTGGIRVQLQDRRR
jgi:hypothetical protein